MVAALLSPTRLNPRDHTSIPIQIALVWCARLGADVERSRVMRGGNASSLRFPREEKS